MALYQFGLVGHLPDPPGSIFDSDRVDASGEAYAVGRTPDATLALVSYGVTLALIGMGGEDRSRTHPWIAFVQALKVAADTASAAMLTVEQVSKHRAVCFWCLAGASGSDSGSAAAVAAGGTRGAAPARTVNRWTPRAGQRRKDDEITGRRT